MLKKIEFIKRNQIEILENKKLQNKWKELFLMPRTRILKSDQNKEQIIKKNNTRLHEVWDTTK